MTRTLFPAIPDNGAARRQSLPLLREVKWDFDAGRAVFDRGRPVMVEGAEAVKVWAWHAVQASRYRYEHESWRYGCELDRLRGRGYRQGTIEAETRRYVTEALLASPYITSAEVERMEFEGDTLHFTVRYQDIYGEGEIHV